ncbi:hypothetical protein N7445_005238 [Penicillium cf. griseofulvum]|nr:hypothetical protein N7445_005238 [Penicillium cf. griseofulvum]
MRLGVFQLVTSWEDEECLHLVTHLPPSLYLGILQPTKQILALTTIPTYCELAGIIPPTLQNQLYHRRCGFASNPLAGRKELGLEGSCAYSPTEAELKQHVRDYEDFEAVQALKSWLRDTLDTNSDGWVPNEDWDAAKVVHRAAYDEWIQTAKEAEARGEDMTVEKADKMWPFDAR